MTKDELATALRNRFVHDTEPLEHKPRVAPWIEEALASFTEDSEGYSWLEHAELENMTYYMFLMYSKGYAAAMLRRINTDGM